MANTVPHTPEGVEAALHRRILGQPTPSTRAMVAALAGVERAESSNQTIRRWSENEASFPTVSYINNVLEGSKDQFYPKVYEIVAAHPVTLGIAALLTKDAQSLSESFLPLFVSTLGRHEQDQLATFCEEASCAIREGGRLRASDVKNELTRVLSLLSTSEGDDNDNETSDAWLQEFRKIVRIRCWYPNTLVSVLWFAMQMPGPPSPVLQSLCCRRSLSSENSPAHPSIWLKAIDHLPTFEHGTPYDALFEEPLASKLKTMTIAQILTCTQPHYDELWTRLGWPCRRRVHDEIQEIRALWKPEYGMDLCTHLMQQLAG